MKIYHNPRCRKSRETLALIEAAGVQPEIRLYMTEPPSKKELKSVLSHLNLQATDVLRKNEKIYKEQFKDASLSESKWIDAMIEFPQLMERPIVVKGNKAIIGRPPENVNALF